MSVSLSRLRYLLSRLSMPSRRRRLLVERLGEPLHLNAISLFVALFGGTRAKIDFDLVVRQQFAFPMLYAADLARLACAAGSGASGSRCTRCSVTSPQTRPLLRGALHTPGLGEGQGHAAAAVRGTERDRPSGGLFAAWIAAR